MTSIIVSTHNLPEIRLVSNLEGQSQLPHGIRHGLWLLACWDFRFEFHRKHGCLSLVMLCVVYVAVSTLA